MIYNVIDYGVISSDNKLQTNEIQSVIDKCQKDGGTVVFPKGIYLFSGLKLYSNMILYLKNGAKLLGSENCDDYPVFDVPKGVKLHTDLEMIPFQNNSQPRSEYRRAMISAYGEKNISVIGEHNSVIDGQNCYDKDGEENYRGPHGIFFSNCKNIALKGYTIQHSGNFMHQLDTCKNIIMEDVTCLGGSDGIHLHLCENIKINRSIFRTGDDCIAGINMKNLYVNNCVLNTSCHAFRIGGVNILVENCHVYGPGYYPHRVTIVKSKTDVLPREEGRHNLIALMIFFASRVFPAKKHSQNIVFRNLIVENAGMILNYLYNDKVKLQAGDKLRDVTFENVRFIGLEKKSCAISPKYEPCHIKLKNVSVSYLSGENDLNILDEDSEYTKLSVK